VKEPIRSEKYLSACAAGLWVLQKAFIDESVANGSWVDESLYEWNETVVDPKLKNVAAAPRKWREKLKPGQGSFYKWQVILWVGTKQQLGLQQVLEAGGAKIKYTEPPFENIKGIKFAFIDKKQFHNHREYFASLEKAGIPCLAPDFLSDFLLKYCGMPKSLSEYDLTKINFNSTTK